MAELIGGGGGGYNDVQATEPSNPSIGDTWLDTSDGDATGKIYADLGNGAGWQILPVQDELQSGRTRELLLMLQDDNISFTNAVDPMNLQSGLSEQYESNNDDYQISTALSQLKEVSTGSSDIKDNSWTQTGSVTVDSRWESANIDLNWNTDPANAEQDARIRDTTNNVTVLQILDAPGDSSGTEETSYDISSFGDVTFVVEAQVRIDDPNKYRSISAGADIGLEGRYRSGNVTDRFDAPTTEPTAFKAWKSIQAQEVSTGGSTSPEPVEFEILDSTDSVLNSTKIPKALIADEPFTMRNRVYSETAGSNGQSDYSIATTGDGGHFGIPILAPVSIKKNNSVLDPANWSFDGDTTVTIDTSNVTIESGDTIEIKYDFDVFDSTLQPKAYLSRESKSETSPSISHFRYEYVI